MSQMIWHYMFICRCVIFKISRNNIVNKFFIIRYLLDFYTGFKKYKVNASLLNYLYKRKRGYNVKGGIKTEKWHTNNCDGWTGIKFDWKTDSYSRGYSTIYITFCYRQYSRGYSLLWCMKTQNAWSLK